MVVSMLLLTFFGVFAIDYLPIIKSKKKKMIVVYGFLFAVSFVMLMLSAQGFQIPSPIKPIMNAIKHLVG